VPGSSTRISSCSESGVPTEIEFFSVYRIRGSRFVDQTAFFDRAEAESALLGRSSAT